MTFLFEKYRFTDIYNGTGMSHVIYYLEWQRKGMKVKRKWWIKATLTPKRVLTPKERFSM